MAAAQIYTGFLQIYQLNHLTWKDNILYSFYSSSIFKGFSFLFSIHLLHYVSGIYMEQYTECTSNIYCQMQTFSCYWFMNLSTETYNLMVWRCSLTCFILSTDRAKQSICNVLTKITYNPQEASKTRLQTCSCLNSSYSSPPCPKICIVSLNNGWE